MAGEEAIALILFGTFFTFAYLSVNLSKEKHGTLQILFIFLSLFTALGALNVGMLIPIGIAGITETISTLYVILMWSTIFSVFYFIIMFFWNSTNLFHNHPKNDEIQKYRDEFERN